MALSKTTNFENHNRQLSDLAKVLSHPARLAILRTLAQNDTLICGEIVSMLPLAQSTVSQHLKELKKHGLIDIENDGPRSCYTINWSNLRDYFSLVEVFVSDLGQSLNASLI